MASRFSGSCSPLTVVVIGLAVGCCARPQGLLKPVQPGEPVMLLPSDMALLEVEEPRKDLPCTVTQRKAELGFDLRFHSGYQVSIPMHELSGDSELLTVVFRAYPQEDKSRASYFVQHFRVPVVEEDAKGEAILDGAIDVGPGKYHVDWLIRDRSERACSSSWDVEAALPPKDKPMPLFIDPNQIEESTVEPFINDSGARPAHSEGGLDLKLLVNFAPQNVQSASLQRTDTDALVSILKTIQRDPHVRRLSLVAFNMEESRVIYRQETAEQIDFPALGKAIQTMKLGTVDVAKLTQKHSETDFLQSLIEKEIGNNAHPDAVIFAGPKAMLNADVPQEELRRIGDIECPVFYMNYNLNPQAVPWKDSISHAIKPFKGVEYTISRPRDLWLSTSEMFNRIMRSKGHH
ncbi:MAG: hypothetical protein JO182_25460, partial [Acidobacteriaceae bacterium]|nr:hypothetical protein [Acidobacteriaceae bacterium]